MKKILAALIVIASFSHTAPAAAESDEKLIRLFGNILIDVVRESADDEHYRRDYHEDDYDYRPRREKWVDKWSYENDTGHGCPGPIDYVDGTYVCQIR